MMNNKDFIAFIISHGRPDNVITYRTLRRLNYTGPIRIVIDNTDKKADEYYKQYPDEVVVFDKPAIAKTTDQGDNFNNLRTTTHARNAVFNIAKDLGYKYFVVLDDDYRTIDFRFDNNYKYTHKGCKNIDYIFDIILEFYKKTKTTSICLAQGGDYIGGENSGICNGNGEVTLSRKAMNSFFCSVDRPFKFFSRLNEDVNTYMLLGSIGHIFFTTNQVNIEQTPTQATSGGMTEAYLDHGTYVKSFYSVMYMPSFIKVRKMGVVNMRLHHKVSWKNAVPKILRADLKKI